jgi:replicative superfamily II helicase
MEKNLSDEEIYFILSLKQTSFGSTASKTVPRNQDYYFLIKFLDFLKNHTTQAQFESILLQKDFDNDTMLQYAESYEYPDNYVQLANIYASTFPTFEEIRKTYTDRDKNKLVSFSYIIKSSSKNVTEQIAIFMGAIFQYHENELIELLSRRNENGDTVFSLYRNQKLHKEKLFPFLGLLQSLFQKQEDFYELLNKKNYIN